ncbi:hypothetical protein GQ44DRAFT_742021 [Phaeosphaeriaceae sp. PMI808]|nr:hypothetical protein GQ44DRAFT_742021 [Phaeosphaeriaceae sp. PMI808]
MGGVGKTQIALQYANRHQESYTTILWITADNIINMSQNDSWILVFDKADGLELLRHVWPTNGKGSVLPTTRGLNAVHSPASKVLLNLVGLDYTSTSNRENAIKITGALGGLNLTLKKIGDFIVQQKMHIRDFLPLYERNTSKIDARKTSISDYEHTLSIKLEGNDQILFNIQSYFNLPNTHIQSRGCGRNCTQDRPCKKGATDASLDRQRKAVNIIVHILSWAFPDTWSEDVGHQFQSWANCEKCFPHVNLVAQRKRHNMGLDFLYLYERECYNVAKSLITTALETFENKNTLSYASTVGLSSLLDLDMNEPDKALIYLKMLLGLMDDMIASSLNNVALAYTELGVPDKAYTTHEEAIRIRLSTNSLLLRMNRPSESEEMLKRCSSLEDFMDETFIQTGNPRFSGDMALLSRIRVQQGRIGEALRLASEVLAFRQKLLGNRLETCDSLYDTASAMAYFKINTLYDENGRHIESSSCKDMAVKLRADLKPGFDGASYTEEDFRKLCVWMLW